MALGYGLLDEKSIGILCTVKAFRFGVFWLLLYVMDKVYQSKYVERVFVEHKTPETLRNLPLFVVGLEGVAFAMVFALLLLFERRFKTAKNTFIVDEVLLMQVIVDYVLTTACILIVGMVVARAVTNCGLLRYQHDGLRGIRAATRLMLYLTAILIAVPCFLAM